MNDSLVIGVLGLGSFGSFAAGLLPKHAVKLGFDANDSLGTPPGIRRVPFEELAAANIIIIAVPLEAYQKTLRALRPLIKPETLIIDVCSVKVQSSDIMHAELPGHKNILITHPLFGPHSAKPDVKGHEVIVTEAHGALANKVLAYCREVLGLRIHRMSAEAHDKIMAQVHVLTFFVARGLGNLHLPDVPFQTPSYTMLLDLIAFNENQSELLFNTIQYGNPYGEAARQELVKVFTELASELSKKPGSQKSSQ